MTKTVQRSTILAEKFAAGDNPAFVLAYKGRIMKNDFSKGKVSGHIINQALPLMVAQLVHLLYNVVDRIYIGHLPGIGSMALTGIGLAFPLTTLTAAFTNLFGMGGAPLFSIARGAGDEKRAEKILGQVTGMLLISSVVVFTVAYIFRRPILYRFGASDASYVYANQYLRIYLFGTTFSMISTGLNNFINAQGFPKMGMLTVAVGAVMNLILDPVFIFLFDMGVAGAALATVLSQVASAVWVVMFFNGKKTLYHIKREYMKPEWEYIKDIVSLGTSGFIMQATNCLTQVICNVTLRNFGGDVFVGIMTVLNSIREILTLPAHCVTNGAQPVISYNYGARKYGRVRDGIKYMSVVGSALLIVGWGLVMAFPSQLMSVFTNDQNMIQTGISSLQLYFFGFIFMAFQLTGQATFTSMKCSKRAIFFSLLRKAIIVAPLTIILPRIGFGVQGVFMAEPISNLIGGIACYVTMFLTLYRRLPKEDGVDFVA